MAIPDIAPDIRDEFVVHAANEVQRNARWLFAFLFLTTPLAIMAGHAETPVLVRWGLPLVMGAYCLMGFVQLSRPMRFREKPKYAAAFVVDASISSCFGAFVSSAWCVASWLTAPADDRLQFPIILVMGALATAYCLANVRIGAIANLVIDLLPISLLLLASGRVLDFAAGFSLLLAGMFQWRMINAHHRHVIDLLHLQKQNRTLALTDPLTGLLNRRALLDFAEALAAGADGARLMIIDIDRFKAINDAHGHDTGDEVLIAIARLVEARAGNNVSAARMGGEEFALLGTPEALPAATALALVAEIRAAAMPHGGTVTASIGIAEGPLGDEQAWRELYCRADEALYQAKRTGRNRACHADEPAPALPARRATDRPTPDSTASDDAATEAA